MNQTITSFPSLTTWICQSWYSYCSVKAGTFRIGRVQVR